MIAEMSRRQILGHNCETKVIIVFLLLSTVTSTNGFETGLQRKYVYGNLKSENSQDYGKKPQRNCTFMSSASAKVPEFLSGTRLKPARLEVRKIKLRGLSI
jgi:hypothetical protein